MADYDQYIIPVAQPSCVYNGTRYGGGVDFVGPFKSLDDAWRWADENLNPISSLTGMNTVITVRLHAPDEWDSP